MSMPRKVADIRAFEAETCRYNSRRSVRPFVDNGVSGARGREKRPQYDALCNGSVRREFDVVMAWSVDRLGRSLQYLVGFLGELHGSGVDLYLHQQGIDTTMPAGKAMFQMCGVFAEFEPAMLQERVRAGLERARASGKRLGRPRVPSAKEAAIRRARAEGKGIKRIDRELGVGVSVVQRVVQDASRSSSSSQSSTPPMDLSVQTP